MSDTSLGPIESRFAELIWERAPISSGELVKLAEQELSWKKSTTYTILRRLCQKGLFQNEGGIVTVLMTKEEFASLQSRQFVAETFDGSLPRFLAAFASREKLSEQEIAAIQQLIDESRG